MKKMRNRQSVRSRKQKKRKNPKCRPEIFRSKSVFRIVPNPLEGVSVEGREQFLKKVASETREKFEHSKEILQRISSNYDPLTALSMLASYELMEGIGDQGLVSVQDRSVGQPYIEAYQAMCLMEKNPSVNYVKQSVYQELRDALHGISETAHLDIEGILSGQILSAQDRAVRDLQYKVRLNSKIIRNWGFYHQVPRLLKELYADLDSELEKIVGFSSKDLISVFEALMFLVEQRATQTYQNLIELNKIQNKEEFVRAFFEIFPEKGAYEKITATERFRISSFERVVFTFFSMHDQSLKRNFLFKSEELVQKSGISDEKIQKIMHRFSFEFGDIAPKSLDELLISNPIWTKPLIKIAENEYFCSLPQVFFGFSYRIIEQVIPLDLKSKASRKRSLFLERKIEELLKKRFVNSEVVRGVKWRDGSAVYESDVIVFIDAYAIVVEAKSGKISESAFRGSAERIKTHLKELFFEANAQSKRVENKLYGIAHGKDFDPEFERQIPYDLRKIKKVIRVCLTLEDFSALQSNLKSLDKTGWLPQSFEPCPTMTIADFETVLDVLEHPIQILHYLERRITIEREFNYFADELDLIGLYLDTLLELKVEGVKKEHRIFLTGNSCLIDNYYNSVGKKTQVQKPRPQISPLWIQIITQLEGRKVWRWTEIGSMLLNISPKEQVSIALRLAKAERVVRKNWRKPNHLNAVIYTPPKYRNTALLFVLYRDENIEMRDVYRDNAINRVFSNKDVEKCLVITRNIDNSTSSYDQIYIASSS